MRLIPRSLKPSSAALFWGIGSSASYYTWNAASKNGIEFRLQVGAATGDSRAMYIRMKFAGAGGGEAGRFYSNVSATGVAAGGTVNGIHASLSVDTSSSISGLGNALRATLGAAAATRTLGGTASCLMLDSDIGASNTVPATTNGWAFLRVSDTGSVKIPNLMAIPAPSNGTIFAAHTTQIMTHSIKFIADGTAYYLMATNAASNRS